MVDIPGRLKKGRPKTRWKDVCKGDINTVGLNTVEPISRATWRKKSLATPATPHDREKPGKKIQLLITELKYHKQIFFNVVYIKVMLLLLRLCYAPLTIFTCNLFMHN